MKRFNPLRMVMVWFLCFSFGHIVSAQEAEVAEEPAAEVEEPVVMGEGGSNSSLPGIITPWARYGEDYTEGLLDVLIPFYYNEEEGLLVFTNLRTAFNDVDEEELNIGLGIRQQVTDSGTIVGANAFYDSRWTRNDSQFNQLGLGAEVLSTWVDARINGYFPEDTKEHVDTLENTYLSNSSSRTTFRGFAEGNTIYEEQKRTTTNEFTTETFKIYDVPLEGMDAEIGVKLPLDLEHVEARIFGGYYSFEPVWDGNVADDNEIEGFKGRLEVRIKQNFLIDAEVFEDDRLFGSDYLVSARVQLPFDLSAIARGENPFKDHREDQGGARSRLTEMVMRDPHIQVRQEIGQTTTSEEVTSVVVRNVAVMEDVIFVDGDNGGDAKEDGSAEHPFNEIQEGVNKTEDSSFDTVFVFGADKPYYENVEVSSGINLYGEGVKFGNGTSPGDGSTPVVRSAGNGPAIFSFSGDAPILFSGFVVDGDFDLSTTVLAPPSVVSVATVAPPVFEPVIFGALVTDARRITIINNTFRDLPIGVAGVYTDDSAPEPFQMVVSNNRFERNGIAVGGILNTKGVLQVSENTIKNSLLGVGALNVFSDTRSTVRIDRNRIFYDEPMDVRQFNIVDGLLEDLAPGLPDELPLPSIGGILVGAVNGKLDADISDNVVDGTLLGITAVSLDLSGPKADLGLSITGNTVLGGGLSETIDLLLESGILDSLLPFSLPSEGLDLPFRAGLSGIAAVAIGKDAKLNDMVISGNDVRDNFLGITAFGMYDAVMKDGFIGNNLLVDNVLGITGVGLYDGHLNRLTIQQNNIQGGGTRKLVPIIEDLLGPIPFEVPDFSLAGITLIGYETEDMNDITVSENIVEGHLLGITAIGIEDVKMKDLMITDNILDRNLSGILVYGVGDDVKMTRATISGNQVSGGGTAFIADVIGAFLSSPIDFPNWGLAGISVVGVNEAKLNDFVITENTVSNQLIGIGMVGWNDANVKDGTISDNLITYGGIGVGAVSINGGSVNDLMVTGNTLTGEGAGLPGGLPIGPVTLFGEKATVGVGVFALGGKAKDVDVSGNDISNNEIGVVILEDGGNISGSGSSGNTFTDNDTDEMIDP